MTLSVMLPYLLVLAGWLLRHFNLFGHVELLNRLLGKSAPLPTTRLPLPTVNLGNHPILSDAVNAAIKQAVADAVAGHIASLKGEILASAKAAAEAAAADLKAKI